MGRRRKFWGWGYEDEDLGRDEKESLAALLAGRFGSEPLSVEEPPALAEIQLRPPRLQPPASLRALLTDDAYERAGHSYGKSYRDVIRAYRRDLSPAPDWVGLPRNEEDVSALLAWAGEAGLAAIPYGGGSSLGGGGEAPAAGAPPRRGCGTGTGQPTAPTGPPSSSASKTPSPPAGRSPRPGSIPPTAGSSTRARRSTTGPATAPGRCSWSPSSQPTTPSTPGSSALPSAAATTAARCPTRSAPGPAPRAPERRLRAPGGTPSSGCPTTGMPSPGWASSTRPSKPLAPWTASRPSTQG